MMSPRAPSISATPGRGLRVQHRGDQPKLARSPSCQGWPDRREVEAALQRVAHRLMVQRDWHDDAPTQPPASADLLAYHHAIPQGSSDTARNDLCDRFWRHAAQAESERMFPNFVALPMICCPLPPTARRPYRAVY